MTIEKFYDSQMMTAQVLMLARRVAATLVEKLDSVKAIYSLKSTYAGLAIRLVVEAFQIGNFWMQVQCPVLVSHGTTDHRAPPLKSNPSARPLDHRSKVCYTMMLTA